MANPVNQAQNVPLYGDYTPYLQAVSYIPLVGIFTSFVQERIVMDEMEDANQKANKADRIIPLTELANKYKAANIARNLLTIALIVTALALDIIPYTLIGGACSLISLGFCVADTFSYAENKKALRAMRRDSDDFYVTVYPMFLIDKCIQEKKAGS